MKQPILFLLLAVACAQLFSCSGHKSARDTIQAQLEAWQGKEILFPEDIRFTTVQGDEEVDFQVSDSTYKILTYLDSIGCGSCKLNLAGWKKLVEYFHEVAEMDVQFLFFFHPDNVRDVKVQMKRDSFAYPVCFDREDALNKLNHFSSELQLQTFLLDKDNKVVAVGNPVYSPQVKGLYLRILAPALKQENINQTEASVSSQDIRLGTFKVGERRDTTVYIHNTGSGPLVAYDVQASCGCTEVEYDQHPILPGDSLALRIGFEYNQRGAFDKIVLLYGNVAKSPLVFHVRGMLE